MKRIKLLAAQILAVDDSLPWQKFLLEMFALETELKIISVASDGLEAVLKAKELQPEVILMDITLQGMNGFEATRQIRRVSPASKILFLSGHRAFELIKGAFDLGASGYVLKSDSGSDLIHSIQAVLRGERFVSRSLKDWDKGSSSIE